MLTKLTPHFSLEELTHSVQAITLGIDNKPTPEHLANLQTLAYGLEVVRHTVNRPINITSGYRCQALNTAVLGVRNSAHALGFAADFTAQDQPARLTALALVDALPFDQLIYEASRGIVHISFDPRLRQQVLTQRGGAGTPFEKGIMR